MNQARIIEHEDYTIYTNQENLLGSGTYGQVYKCHKKDQNNNIIPTNIAVKLMPIKFTNRIIIRREMEILNTLLKNPCPNLIYVDQIHVNYDRKECFIFMEECTGGDLDKEIKNRQTQKNWFSLQEVISIITQIINGYRVLNQKKIIHRDIKPLNILIQNGVYKLTDFGLGKILDVLETEQKLTNVGTSCYKAPQLIMGKPSSEKCDVYSLGVLFYQLIYGQKPIEANSDTELIKKLQQQNNTIECPAHNKEKTDVPYNIRSLLQYMLAYEESNRIDWNSLFKQFLPQEQKITFQNDSYFLKIKNNEQQQLTPPQMINQYIKVLATKGKLAQETMNLILECYHLIQMSQYELLLVEMCLQGYIYSTIANLQAMVLSDISFISKETCSHFEQATYEYWLLEYVKDNSEEFVKVRSDILEQEPESKQLFLVRFSFKKFQQSKSNLLEYYQNNVKDDISNKFIALIKQENQSNYIFYYRWLDYFYKSFLKNKLTYNKNENYPLSYLLLLFWIEILRTVEQDYPQEQYIKFDISTNPFKQNFNEEYIRQYIQNKRQTNEQYQ